MAAPHPRLRKHLSAPGLLKTIRRSFEAMADHRHQRSQISLADALMAGLAVFGLKYPSLLKFDEAYREGVIRHNLKALYGVEWAPCDMQLRTILDGVDPPALRSAFRAVHRHLQRHRGELAKRSKPVTPAGKLVTKWAKEYFGADEDGVPAQVISVDIGFDTNDPVPICLRKHRDNYGRPIAYVYKAGKNYNLKAMEGGWSPYFMKYGRPASTMPSS